MSSLDRRKQKQRAELEQRALAAEERSHNAVGKEAQLEAAITAAELCMQALKITDNAADRKRLDAKTKSLILKAEEIKRLEDRRGRLEHPTSSRKLTTRENIILLEGSKLNGAIFKPWISPPEESDFQLRDGQQPFEDDFHFSLSESQLKHFAGWKRPKDALALIRIEKDGEPLPNEATMDKLGQWDMVQDVVPDCSVIASFCVGIARAERGYHMMFGTTIYPYDHTADRPILSQNGRYVMRLYFNGCWRRVDIDDRLPTSKSTRVLHVIDRSHPGLLWPALAEKAYLKVRGGYDFPGSNSGTDLAVITGWIPQQIFLHDEDVDSVSLWEELSPALAAGRIMVTLGTGKLGKREQQLLGLGAEHDYAVLDVKEVDENREMLIKNPWADGDVWKGATRSRPNPGHEDEVQNSSVQERDAGEMKPGTFWMDFNSVFQYFEHMYINYDPGLFKFRADMHFSWTLPEVTPAGNLLIENPQFSIRAGAGGDVWILLNRHFRTGDFSTANHGKNGYISLYLFNKNGERVLSGENARVRGPFVDSPNTLLRLRMAPRETQSVAVVMQDLPTGKHNFTISAFSNTQVEVRDALQIYQAPQQLPAAWTRSTAGGSSDSPRYLQNPQFSLTIASEGRIALVLQSLKDPSSSQPDTELHVKILVASSDGKRITKLRQRDIVANSGDYRRGAAVIEKLLGRGTYTVICSTFEQNQFSKFHLDLYTTDTDTAAGTRSKLAPLPSEGSGRLTTTADPAIFTASTTKQIAPLSVDRITRALFRASLTCGSGSALFRLSLEQGQGPYRRTIAASSGEGCEFTAVAPGLRIEDVDLDARMAAPRAGGLWLVLERPGQASTESRDVSVITVEVLSEEKIAVGEWAVLED